MSVTLPRNTQVDDAFDAASAELVKAVFAAPGGDRVAIVSLAYDMRTSSWMINSNVKADGFAQFLENALKQAREHMHEIKAVSDALDKRGQA